MCYDEKGNWMGCYAPEFCDSEPPDQVQVHVLEAEAAHDPYAVTQCGYLDDEGNEVEIRDGDVIVIPSEGLIGILVGAWPVVVAAIEGQEHGFHEVLRWSLVEENSGRSYADSRKRAMEVAHMDADITGNRHWAKVDL